MSTIVGEDELFVISEAFVFNAVLSWVKDDRDNRSNHLPFLLAKVRLPLLTPQFLSDTVASDELIRASHKVPCIYYVIKIVSIFYHFSVKIFIQRLAVSFELTLNSFSQIEHQLMRVILLSIYTIEIWANLLKTSNLGPSSYINLCRPSSCIN